MFIDGALYWLMAIFSAMIAVLSTDQAAKNIEASLLFWLQSVTSVLNAGFLAIKMFRSTAFADHKKEEADKPVVEIRQSNT